ncbi:negative regulation of cellular response to hepatocyte growth factor stimulus [Branchiostoma belcheri]|nr:negative regulation of cellular response to hepatocyte growth factor stimulus [Branchiostoma belcheri]
MFQSTESRVDSVQTCHVARGGSNSGSGPEPALCESCLPLTFTEPPVWPHNGFIRAQESRPQPRAVLIANHYYSPNHEAPFGGGFVEFVCGTFPLTMPSCSDRKANDCLPHNSLTQLNCVPSSDPRPPPPRRSNRRRDEIRRDRWENKHHHHQDGGEQHGGRARARRSISKERFVETLVVVDKKMIEYHRDDDVEKYVLTLLNMVSRLYHDPSIGNLINIVLVRLMLLEEEPEELSISHHADHTMSSFCKWSKSINPKDEMHPNHHDVAILLTRYDICTGMNEPCGTLGLAQVYGMCQPHRSCNINEDTGLAVAFTMAHEIGHNFGMKHDDEKSGCQTPPQQRPHVMSHLLTTQTSPLAWSNCSRDTVTTFLE